VKKSQAKEETMRTILRLATFFVVEPCLGLAVANAGSCTDQISQIEHFMQQRNAKPLAQQAIGAQLHHQPTQQSVENAAEKGLAEVSALLARARALDSEGSAAECMNLVARLKIQLGPGATTKGR
jgi:hypothetical protein